MSTTTSNLPYTRSDAKEWAREHLKGVCNVVMPSFTSDFSSLNAKAIEHDVRHCAKLGYSGTLLVSECSTTLREYIEFMEIAAGARPDGFQLVLHGSFNSVDETIEAAGHAEKLGFEGLLLSYDPNFYPASEDDVFEYTKRVADGTDIGLILFAVPMWGFGRFHASGFSPFLIERMADLETAVALKYEANHPGLPAGMADIVRRVGEKVVVSDPMEFNGPGWIDAYGMQWMGTSGYEYFGERVPRWFSLLSKGRWDEGMEVYWSVQPARAVRGGLHQSIAGAKLIHRPAWKFMGWLQGFNGGALRMPQMRLDGALMDNLRQGLLKSGYDIADEPNEAFFAGRNPA